LASLICTPCTQDCHIDAYIDKKSNVFNSLVDMMAFYKLNGYGVTETGPFCQRN
jgi:hypothetical protein